MIICHPPPCHTFLPNPTIIIMTIVDILHAMWSWSQTQDIPCSRKQRQDRETERGWSPTLQWKSRIRIHHYNISGQIQWKGRHLILFTHSLHHQLPSGSLKFKAMKRLLADQPCQLRARRPSKHKKQMFHFQKLVQPVNWNLRQQACLTKHRASGRFA